MSKGRETILDRFFRDEDDAIAAYENQYGLEPVPETPFTPAGSEVPETEEQREDRLRKLELAANRIQLDKNLRRNKRTNSKGSDDTQSKKS